MNERLPKQKQMLHAFRKSIPVMAGYIVLSTGFGILLREKGYGVFWAFAMSLFIYAGSLQFVRVSLLTSSASLLSAFITSVMVNARHLFYSISMLEKYRNAGVYKPYSIFALTDETYSLLSDNQISEGCDPAFYRFMVSLFNHGYWIFGSVIGSLPGSALPFSSEGIEFSMTALFASSLTEQWISSEDHLPALCGLFSSLISLLVFGKDNFLIPAMILITCILALTTGRERT